MRGPSARLAAYMLRPMLHAGVVARWLMPTELTCAMFRAQCLGKQLGCSSWTGCQRVVHHHTAGCTCS